MYKDSTLMSDMKAADEDGWPINLSMWRRENFTTRTPAVAEGGAAVAAFPPILVLRAREMTSLSQIAVQIKGRLLIKLDNDGKRKIIRIENGLRI